MNIKKIVWGLSLFYTVLPSAKAQDDMYFTPKKVDKIENTKESNAVRQALVRDVDEYNRRNQYSSQYQNIDLDTLYSDVIIVDSVSADTIVGNVFSKGDIDYAYDPEDDYTYSRRLSRYDDYYWHDPWYYGWYGYGPYWYGSPYWWYDSWYDPWFYGWHRPWNWYYSWHWPVVHYRPYRGITGTTNHGRPHRNNGVNNKFRKHRDAGNLIKNNRNNRKYNNNRTNYNNRFRGNRQNDHNWNNSPSRPIYNNSFGGNRSGGSFRRGGSFGGNRSGGGGSFRGRR